MTFPADLAAWDPARLAEQIDVASRAAVTPAGGSGMSDPHRPVAMVTSPSGAAYRGKAGCTYLLCSRDGNPDRCYGWHCFYCDGPSNCQGDCSNRECPGKSA